ncbi:MAG: YggS family pyridoxal phosphate-dependent enzyme [Phycisphaeraceae bacterium]|nr:YggS family pyridoxal phosphate-dependent enzyme [Phycisphaeraceae bacterium]
MSELRDNYEQVKERIADAASRSGRDPSSVMLVAVTKYASDKQVRELLGLGHRDLGENRVKQLSERVKEMSVDTPDEPIRWHMVGHLQRNKVKSLLGKVRLIHSVDTLKLAEQIHRDADGEPVDVLVQVNPSGEASKSGLMPPAVPHVIEQMHTLGNLRIRGLMTMAPHAADPEMTRPVFAQTSDLFHECRDNQVAGDQFNILSMGMTNDFEVAIEEGANLVRIGSALFGAPD